MSTEAEGAAIISKVFSLVRDDDRELKETIAVTFLAGNLLDEPDRMRREALLQKLIGDLRNAVEDLAKLQASKSPEEFADTLKEVWLREVGRLPLDAKGRRLH